jgi:uncharacterized RDD family membrane protein YckC
MEPRDANQAWGPPGTLSGTVVPPRPEVPLPPGPLPAGTAFAGLGIRALALLIDALASLVVAIPLAGSQGGLQASNGSFRAELTGVPFLVAVVAWLAYMTLAEATVGASLGKLLVGVRVRRADGGRVTVAGAAVRNLLRLIDALPYFIPYLVGGVAVARSPQRQRLGDRAAGTVVVRAHSVQVGGDLATPAPWWPRVVLGFGLVIILAATYGSAVMAGHCDIGNGVYDCHDVRFEYPGSWSVVRDVKVMTTGNLEFADVVALDAVNNVELQAYRLNQSIDRGNIAQSQQEVSAVAERLAETLSGTVADGPRRIEMGGLPGFSIRIEGRYGGQPLTLEGVVLARGTTQYFLECQFTPDHASEIRSGCEQVMRTFRPT